ncbi:MAG: dCTP deaminase, partial [Acidobacteriota bacterium]
MIKPDRWIRAWGEAGGVTPFEPSQVNSASYDVRVSEHWICPTRDPEEFRAPHVKLFPGEVVLASTMEYVRIPRNVACDLKLKSTLGRLWINHSLAGWCDPGFEG